MVKQSETAGLGHNSEGVVGDQLKSLIERIERLEEDKKAIADDIKEVYGEAKANGFQNNIIRKVIARRRRTRDALAEEEAMLELYEQAIGAFG